MHMRDKNAPTGSTAAATTALEKPIKLMVRYNWLVGLGGAPDGCLPAGPASRAWGLAMGRAWLGLWLPAGGALGCLACPAGCQSAPLGALGSDWVEASPSAR